MKRSTHLRLVLMASALPVALTACDNPTITGNQGVQPDWQAADIASVDCTTTERMQTDACKAQLERLLDTSRRYGSQQDCEQSNTECAQVKENGGSPWIGPVTGFVGGMLLSQALNDLSGRRYNAGYRGGYRTGNTPATTGRTTYPTAGAPPPPPPTRAITESRSGFGSTSSARRSFGG